MRKAFVDISDIQHRLTTFVAREFLEGDDRSLTPTTPLLEWGVLDSLSMLALLSFIEDDLRIEVPDEMVRPEHFQNLDRLAHLLADLDRDMARGQRVVDQAKATPASVCRATDEVHGVESVEIELRGGARRSVRRSPGPTPAWVLVPDPFNPSSSWGPTMHLQVGKTATWAPGLVGLEPDDDGDDAPSLAGQVDAMTQLVSAIPDGPVVLVGQGLGGAIAAHVARRLPERVSALVVVSFGVIRMPVPWWHSIVECGDYLTRAFYESPLAGAALLERMEATLASRAVHDFVTDRDASLVTDAFQGLALPTLFVGGDTDRVLPPGAIEAAALQVPASRVEWLARCGHLAHVERSQELVSAIRSFVQAHSVLLEST